MYFIHTNRRRAMNNLKNQESSQRQDIVYSKVPNIQKLLISKKIGIKEKFSVLEDINFDIAAYLMSIGEEV